MSAPPENTATRRFAAAAAPARQPRSEAVRAGCAKSKGRNRSSVGDAYNADIAGSAPVPDPNPRLQNGHGSHVRARPPDLASRMTARTYHGRTTSRYAAGFGIGPGVAPLADLYMVRVFGCTGSTNVITERSIGPCTMIWT